MSFLGWRNTDRKSASAVLTNEKVVICKECTHKNLRSMRSVCFPILNLKRLGTDSLCFVSCLQLTQFTPYNEVLIVIVS